MISTQVNNAVLCPKAYVINRHHVKGLKPLPPPAFLHCPSELQRVSLKVTSNTLKCKQIMPVCSSGGAARVGDGNQEPLWKSFGKAIQNLGKKPSVEEVLKQQIEKREFYEGGNPPGGGGGRKGGGGGGFGGLGGSEEEGSSGAFEETTQVILATLGLICMYFYIINGTELRMLARDFIKYKCGGKKSMRLKRSIHMIKCFLGQYENKDKRKRDKYWLQKAIITTPTWWDSPAEYKRVLKAYVRKRFGRSSDNDYEDNDNNNNGDDDLSKLSSL